MVLAKKTHTHSNELKISTVFRVLYEKNSVHCNWARIVCMRTAEDKISVNQVQNREPRFRFVNQKMHFRESKDP